MSGQILILGGTGQLGCPVTRALLANGRPVRVLTRNPENARGMFGDEVEILRGNANNREDILTALAGCDGVHINLDENSEFSASRYVIEHASESGLERITFVSATTACEAHRWFPLIDSKMRTEHLLRESGIPYTIFCPTWVMETLLNFVHGDRLWVIIGRRPPPLHFFAAAEFGRMVAASYEDERALGKRLFIHGPEGITLPEALTRFAAASHPECRVIRMKLWQAKLAAKVTGREGLKYITRLIAYFDRVQEIGDPSEANALFGGPTITLDEWFRLPKVKLAGVPH